MYPLISYKPSSKAAPAELRLARLALRMHASKTDLRSATEDQKKQFAGLIDAKICKFSSEDKIYRLVLRATLLLWELRDQFRAEIQAADGQKGSFAGFHKQSYEQLEIKFKFTKATMGTNVSPEMDIAPDQIPTGANMKLREKLFKPSVRVVPKTSDRNIEDVTL
ncbi:hypothetical protein PspLS_11558 [Pyricularia sp. CBS 133598]|nr:hypothetical protein PspLS_11558 [Pyricularia sp. CBS 133598]